MHGSHALLTALLPTIALMLHAAVLTPALPLLPAACCCCCLLLFEASSQSSSLSSVSLSQLLLLMPLTLLLSSAALLSASLSAASRARRLRCGMFARTELSVLGLKGSCWVWNLSPQNNSSCWQGHRERTDRSTVPYPFPFPFPALGPRERWNGQHLHAVHGCC